MPYTFTLSEIIPATPAAIYNAWLDSRGHSAMTGGKATASAEVGGAFTAWDGYISGRNVQLIPGARIVQTWRSTAFTGAQHSTITVLLDAVPGGTRVTLTHASVPDDHKGPENGGWQDHYFTPMKAYFGKPSGGTKPKAAKAKAAKPKAAKPKAAKAKAVAAKKKTAKAKTAKAKTAKKKSAKAKAAPAKRAKAKVAKHKTPTRKAAVRKTARKAAKRGAVKRHPAKSRNRR